MKQIIQPGLIASAILALIVGLLSPAQDAAAQIRVTHTNDGPLTFDGTCTLREAIRAANTNVSVDNCAAGQQSRVDVISLPAGHFEINLTGGANEDNSITGDLDITSPVIIVGVSPAYTLIDGGGINATDRVFDVRATGEVIMRNVRISDGRPSGADGGNLRVLATAHLKLIDVEVIGGRASSGGGISNFGEGTLIRTLVDGNEALDASGGGIRNFGDLMLFQSRIRNNQAFASGGGISTEGSSSSLEMIESFVAGNSSQIGGGGIAASGPYDIRFSVIEGNQSGDGGGIVAFASGEITHSSILSNTATQTGGGVADSGDGFVRYSTIALNSAPEGGGVYAASNQTLLDSNTVAHNIGDGVYNQSGAFLENNLMAANSGGNCAGNPPAFGAYNLDDANSCGFVDNPGIDQPNFPNTDPLLGPLAGHGGPTPVYSLLPGSPAIDAVSSLIRINCETVVDQRGRVRGRPRDGSGVFFCDIGAYEASADLIVNTVSDTPDVDPADDLCADANGECSLRAAIMQANSRPATDRIVLPAGVFELTRTGSDEDLALTGDLDIAYPVEIAGAGAESTVVDGLGADRVFDALPAAAGASPVFQPNRVKISDLTIRGGAHPNLGGGIATSRSLELDHATFAENEAPDGAGVYCIDDCELQVRDSVFRDNSATSNGCGLLQWAYYDEAGRAVIDRSVFYDNQGGIGGAGETSYLELRNSTVSGNTAGSSAAFFTTSAVVEDSTIAGNSVTSDAAGFYILQPSVFRNSIVADNTVNGVLDNCESGDYVVSAGFNISDTASGDCFVAVGVDQMLTDPLLDVLADNGGPTLTRALLPTSPAIDSGETVFCPPTDQRGEPRPQDGDNSGGARCDVGAFELADQSVDTDGDGVPDAQDNCTLLSNINQEDSDGDGFGNRCDADFNNDNAVNLVDLVAFKAAFGTADDDGDFNSDGAVNLVDLVIMKALFGLPPGPAGAL